MLRRIGAEESGEFKAVASGTLPNGRPVIVNSDGTVSAVDAAGSTSPSSTPVLGNAVVFREGSTDDITSVYDTNSNKLVVAYIESTGSGTGKAIVGTVSGGSITFGTAVAFETGGDIGGFVQMVFDSSNNKVVICYRDDTNSLYGTAVVGTVSGTSISFGTPVVFESGRVDYCSPVFDSTNNKVAIVYGDASSDGVGIVGTVSGTSISFGSKSSAFETGTFAYSGATFDSNLGKVVCAYQDFAGATAYAIVGTVSGTSISFGSKTQIESGRRDTFALGFDTSNNKVLITWKADAGGSSQGDGELAVGTVSGTSISLGSTVTFHSASSAYQRSVSFDTVSNKFVLSYRGTSNNMTYALVTISGTSATVSTKTTSALPDSRAVSAVYDPDSASHLVSFTNSSTVYGTTQIVTTTSTTTNLTSENYIGMSRGVAVQTGDAASVGSATVFESASTGVTASTFDSSNNRIVISYRDSGNSNYATVVVGTVSGSSISFGTPTVFRSAAVSNEALITFDSNSNKVIAGYSHNALGKCKVLTVDPSDNSISVGSETTFDTQQGTYLDMTFDSTNNKVVVVYTGQNNYVETKVGTVSGTSISFGTAVVAMSLSPDQNSITFDSNRGKVVVCSRISTKGRAAVGTVSGTSISFASNVIFADNQTKYIAPTFDSNSNKVVIAYINGSSTDQGQVVVGDIDGSGVISFGSAVTYNAEIEEFQGIAFDSNLNKVVIAYDSKGTSKGQVISGTVSGTSITFDSETVFEAADVEGVSVAFDSNANKSVISYIDAGNSNYGTSVVFTPTTIATTRGEVADGGNASVDVIGSVSDNQIGLTAGQQYFVQTDGTISTTADSPSVLAGTAISATELVVKT